MAIEKVTMYRTSKGGLFETELEAERKEVRDQLLRFVSEEIMSDDDGGYTQIEELLSAIEHGHNENQPDRKPFTKRTERDQRRIKLASQFFAYIDLLRSREAKR